MDFSILGPLEVRADGRSVSLGGTKPRALLAVLLLHPNEPVSAERLALGALGRGGDADRHEDDPGVRVPPAARARRRGGADDHGWRLPAARQER